MPSFSFCIAATFSPLPDDYDSILFACGCDDGTVSLVKGHLLVDFDREATDFAAALASALRDVESSGARVTSFRKGYRTTSAECAELAGANSVLEARLGPGESLAEPSAN